MIIKAQGGIGDGVFAHIINLSSILSGTKDAWGGV
jgi:hypothetical protein